MAAKLAPSNRNEGLIYQTEDGQTRVQLRIDPDGARLTRNQMADGFQRIRSAMSQQVVNAFKECDPAARRRTVRDEQ